MADDQSQRPYRASEPPPARGSGKTGSDPLAELARLIGQTDPFGEYGREVARRSPASQSAARADWNQPLGTSYSAQYSGDARAPEPAPRCAGDGYPSAPASPLIPKTMAVRITGVSPTRLNRLPAGSIIMRPSRHRTGFLLANPIISRIFTTKPRLRTNTTRTLRLR